ncbi:MAG: chorismate mutase [Pseudomonadota bacterium]
MKACNNLAEVRVEIDRLDRQIVSLLAQRGGYVKQAARFKTTPGDVRAPKRVEQVIIKVTDLADELGASPIIVERVYRAMIAGFIDAELAELAETAARDGP